MKPDTFIAIKEKGYQILEGDEHCDLIIDHNFPLDYTIIRINLKDYSFKVMKSTNRDLRPIPVTAEAHEIIKRIIKEKKESKAGITAYDLFEKLNFVGSTWEDKLAYVNRASDVQSFVVEFDLSIKAYKVSEMIGTTEYPLAINERLQEAIDKQMEELKWL